MEIKESGQASSKANCSISEQLKGHSLSVGVRLWTCIMVCIGGREAWILYRVEWVFWGGKIPSAGHLKLVDTIQEVR